MEPDTHQPQSPASRRPTKAAALAAAGLLALGAGGGVATYAALTNDDGAPPARAG